MHFCQGCHYITLLILITKPQIWREENSAAAGKKNRRQAKRIGRSTRAWPIVFTLVFTTVCSEMVVIVYTEKIFELCNGSLHLQPLHTLQINVMYICVIQREGKLTISVIRKRSK